MIAHVPGNLLYIYSNKHHKMLWLTEEKHLPTPAGCKYKPKKEHAKSCINLDADMVASAYVCFLHKAHNQKPRCISLTNHQKMLWLTEEKLHLHHQDANISQRKHARSWFNLWVPMESPKGSIMESSSVIKKKIPRCGNSAYVCF